MCNEEFMLPVMPCVYILFPSDFATYLIVIENSREGDMKRETQRMPHSWGVAGVLSVDTADWTLSLTDHSFIRTIY
jgi:hypothetical protein